MKRFTLSALSLFTGIVLYAQSQLTNSGNFYIHPGASVSFFGNFANDGTLSDSGTVVNFTGTANQVISGSAATNFKNMVINNASGVSLQRSVTVNNSLTLTAGPLQLNSNTLTIAKSAAGSIARTSGYIVSEQTNNSGKISWNIGTGTGAHTYPFGTASGVYIPFVLNLTAGNIGNVIVSTYPTAANNMPYPSSPDIVTGVNDINGNNNSSNTVDRFWQINKDGVSGTATLTFTAAMSEIGSISGLVAQRWNTTNQDWDQPLPGQTGTAVSATVPGVSSFSPWTMSGNGAPLPIELLNFNATVVNNDHVDLNWETRTEINNDYFTIEKTIDGLHFETVAIVDGAGTSSQQLFYAENDAHPYTGISYYRLKQTDVNGLASYSPFVAVEITVARNFSASVFPNPSEGPVSISLSGAGETVLTLTIIDAQGNQVHEKQFASTTGDAVFSIQPDQPLAPGLYQLVIRGNDIYYTSKLIISGNPR